jgi:polar amino acid transport system substrate-binding protein
MRLRVVAALACTLAAFPLGAAEPPLRVGLDPRIPPWSFIPGLQADEDVAPSVTDAQLQRAQGIDVDVAAALGRRLGRPVRLVPVAWLDMEQGLLDGRYDVIVGGWTPSPKTPPQIRASSSYLDWGLQVCVRADDKKVRNFTDLAGTRVGHYRDASVERTLRSLQAESLVPYAVQDKMFEDLKAGKLGAVVFDSPYVRWRVARDPSLRAVGEPINRLGYHVGVRKSDDALFEAVEAAVKDLGASGEGARIKLRWESAP